MRTPPRKFNMAEENQMRGEVRRGVPIPEILAKWGIKIQRLRRVNCGPLKRMGYAIEGIQKR